MTKDVRFRVISERQMTPASKDGRLVKVQSLPNDVKNVFGETPGSNLNISRLQSKCRNHLATTISIIEFSEMLSVYFV